MRWKYFKTDIHCQQTQHISNWKYNIRPELSGVIVFGILVYKGDLFDRLEAPLFKSLNMYEDNPAGNEAEKTKKEAFKQIWNTVQQDVMTIENSKLNKVNELFILPSDEMLRCPQCWRLEDECH